MLLSFNVQKQIITRTDTESVVCNSMNFLYAQFTFSEEWTGTKTAVFKGKEKTYNALLDENDTCLVPWEVLTESWFYVSVFCGDLVTANKVTIYTIPSGYEIGDESRVPTPEIYIQIIEKLNEIESEVDPEAIKRTVDDYIAEKGLVTEDDVDQIVADYVEAHKSEWTGSVVSVTQTLSSGTKIAEIDVDGTTTNLFAPSGGGGGSTVVVTPTITTGTKIAEIDVDGTTEELFAPDTSDKMDKANPTGTGALSLNRRSGSYVGSYSVAVGSNAQANGYIAFAEGYYTAAGANYTHAAGNNTRASYDHQFVVGKFNDVKATTLFEVGNGSSNTRSNAFEVYSDGSLSTDNGTTKIKLENVLAPSAPSTDGTYTLQATVNNGVVTYSWV